jgi:hypothetical protein
LITSLELFLRRNTTAYLNGKEEEEEEEEEEESHPALISHFGGAGKNLREDKRINAEKVGNLIGNQNR